ncbi:pectinesterase-like [Rhododendron vialii]|uniref:pectinesterase-like n=1 Tax=Rhododendron vialii TaxID=182163 RepID=UPI002660440C|nr:pectinesterase-like [Rhododendron vialii]
MESIASQPQANPVSIRYNATVAQDGSGNYTTIHDAIAAAPVKSVNRYYIHIKPGVYKDEYVTVGKDKTNIALIGDSADTTKITGSRSNGGGIMDTPKTATMIVDGSGFMARSITFENSAPPPKSHQAVALTNNANHSAFYQCVFLGYQDTLLANHNRQFYKDCDIYGSVDFVWGYAKAVFQDCRLYARRIGSDGNMVTAQGKYSPTLDSGFSFQNCKVTVDPNLALRKSEVSVVLGRPWMDYATVVFMESFLDTIVKPEGWSIKWDNIPKPHIFYAEYNNSGPGANTSGRVKWPGYRVLTSAAEAIPFTVSKFIDGDAWIPETAQVRIAFGSSEPCTQFQGEPDGEVVVVVKEDDGSRKEGAWSGRRGRDDISYVLCNSPQALHVS